jgi:microcystin-dependent protein
MSVVGVDHIGWLLCDGRAASTDEYRTLFAVLGYRFGGSGSTFNLPNPQGRVLGCAGTSTDNTWSIGDASGEETHTLTTDELPPHNHDAAGTAPPDGPGYTTYEATGVSNQTAGTHAHTGTTDLAGSHLHTGTTVAEGNHDHTASSANAGSHTHSSNATGGQGGLGLVLANGQNTVVDTDQTNGELNVWTTPYALSINAAGDHTHAITVNTNGTHTHAFTTSTDPNHTHTFLSDTSGSHTHAITDPTHRHQIASVGDGAAFSLLQPTLFIGNVFIYAGRPFHRITTGDGITIPTTYPNVFPIDPDYQVF